MLARKNRRQSGRYGQSKRTCTEMIVQFRSPALGTIANTAKSATIVIQMHTPARTPNSGIFGNFGNSDGALPGFKIALFPNLGGKNGPDTRTHRHATERR